MDFRRRDLPARSTPTAHPAAKASSGELVSVLDSYPLAENAAIGAP
ncbi:hypothetical protein [Paraburkholderia sp. RL17-337-BIB-A]